VAVSSNPVAVSSNPGPAKKKKGELKIAISTPRIKDNNRL
jgi:hypothetical protein